MSSVGGSSGLNQSQSTGSSSSRSSSQSFIPNYAEEPLLLSLAQQAQQLEGQQYNWGQQQYANNSRLTDNVINNYLDSGAMSRGMAGNDLSRYQGIYQPEEDQLAQDARTFSSDQRVQSEMGRARADVGQNADAAHAAAVRDLQSYGVDPSSGRYAALDKAEATKRAAAQAGAANQARVQTQSTGRALRDQSIQVGQRYPGQIANALTTGMQANAGASNAALANAQLGTQMLGTPQNYAQIGMGLKYPTLGNSSQSNSQSQNQSTSSGSTSSSNSSTDPQRSSGSNGSNGGSRNTGSTSGSSNSGGSSSGPDWSTLNHSSGNQISENSNAGYGYTQPEMGTYQVNDGGGPGDGVSGIMDSYYGTSDFSGDWPSSYAEGGDVRSGDGGSVPSDLSPSGGLAVDDVPAQVSGGGEARLNVDEYVIPRDVATWKGHEFFQNLINKSRQAQAGATAKPQYKSVG